MVGIGSKFMIKERNTDWLDTLLRCKFFVSCDDHPEVKKNEFCIDCNVGFCKHCETSHCLHRRLQICRYCYHDVVRLPHIQQYLDCTHIQTYKVNGEKAVHLNPKPRSKDAKPSTKYKSAPKCEACGKSIQDMLPNRFCSIACKVSISPIKTKLITFPVQEDCTNWKNNFVSDSTGSAYEIYQSNMSSVLKPMKQLRKRKCVPRRAPLF